MNKKKKKKLERRRYIRHAMSFPLTYRIRKTKSRVSHKEGHSRTINIGRAGLLFPAKHSAKKGAIIRITMPFQDKAFKVNAKVIHCSQDSKTKFYNIGVSFQNPSDAFRVRLIEQMYLISEFRDLRIAQLKRDVTLQEASEEWIKKYSRSFERVYW